MNKQRMMSKMDEEREKIKNEETKKREKKT